MKDFSALVWYMIAAIMFFGIWAVIALIVFFVVVSIIAVFFPQCIEKLV